MARHFKRRRLGRKRRRFVRRRRGTRRSIRRLFRKVRRINSSIETKYTDILRVADAIGPSGSPAHAVWTGLAEGLDEARVGRQITITKIQWKASLLFGLATTTSMDQFQRVRIIFYWDKYYNGSEMALGDILEYTSNTEGALLSNYNWNNRHRFRVIFDKLFFLAGPVYTTGGTDTTFTTNGMNRFIRKIWRPHKKVYYAGASGTISSALNNQLCSIMISDTATVNNPTITSYMRITFKDT